jgi:predicted nucleotidyltransferase
MAMATPHGLPIDLQEAALQEICRRYGVARLALFGSVLRDDFTDQSDIDVLCTLLPDSPAHGLEWIHLKQALEDLWGRPVDLIKPHLLDPLIRDEVLAEERVIYVAP